MAYKHEGFWRSMDTLKDRQVLEDMVEQGKMPLARAVPARGEGQDPGVGLMRTLGLGAAGRRASTVLCLGAHSDDIEIGAGGTLLSWIAAGVRLHVHWCVLSAAGPRAAEAAASAADFLAGAASSVVELADFQDSFFPYQGRRDQAPGSPS